MILTNCAACAAPLGLSLGKKCGRCSTRYCGPACQKQHWDVGHKDFCKQIKKTGGAEQYNANKKYSEAVAVAAEKCAEDVKGQTCYICTQALHWKTKEGLVRGCACRGTSGFAHVSCLAEQAKILVAEAEENNLSTKVPLTRWHTCSLCGQNYHGAVQQALGWACWKTYVGRPEAHLTRRFAMHDLGNGLLAAKHFEDACFVFESELSSMRRLGADEVNILGTQGNLAVTYGELGNMEKALSMEREVYSGRLELSGEEHPLTLRAAYNYAASLKDLSRFEEAKSLLRKIISVARRVLGESDETTLRMRWIYAEALYEDDTATLHDLRAAVTTLEELERTARRVFGGAHPTTVNIELGLQNARAALRAREGDVEPLREAVEAMTPGDAQDDPSS